MYREWQRQLIGTVPVGLTYGRVEIDLGQLVDQPAQIIHFGHHIDTMRIGHPRHLMSTFLEQ